MKPHRRQIIFPALLLLFSCIQHHTTLIHAETTVEVADTNTFAEPPPPLDISCSHPVSLQEWFIQVCKTEKPDKADSVAKYHFVLYDKEDCYLICLVKSKDYPWVDPQQPQKPGNKPLPEFSSLSKTEYKDLPWEKVLEKVTKQLGEFVMIPEYRNSALAKAKSIVIQFDNESMLRLQ